MTEPHSAPRPLGFWTCWALAVGTMIGSGVFLLPTTLAPYGIYGFAGFALAGAGALVTALVFARLAGDTTQSGGPYVYVRAAFGDFAAFLNAWALWISYVITVPILAIAFVGYLAILVPDVRSSTLVEAACALGLIWTFTAISLWGLKEASLVQITLTILKIAPLLLVAALAAPHGSAANLPMENLSGQAPLGAIAAATLVALWPFVGFEAGVLPAGDVRDPGRTIPRALMAGMATVAIVYLAATLGVMALVPSSTLATSAAPFADAARVLGPLGAPLVAIGALFTLAGTLNGALFCCGQMPMAAARDGLAPTALARVNAGGSPAAALLLSSVFGSVLLAFNYTRGLVGAYTLLVSMSTLLVLFVYGFCAAAEIRRSWRGARGWALLALAAAGFALFASFGSGFEPLWQGAALMLAGAPLYLFARRKSAA